MLLGVLVEMYKTMYAYCLDAFHGYLMWVIIVRQGMCLSSHNKVVACFL